jgi:phosphatidylethanolamine/phosphatidyl-N-methylethanolamine N-methyltransferase
LPPECFKNDTILSRAGFRVNLMPLPALQKFEQKVGRQLRLLEFRKNVIERKIERQIRLFEQKRDGIGRKIEQQIKHFELKKGIRLDDEVRFIRSWIERPLSIGAVTPSGKILARTMARYVDPKSTGPVVELGPGTGPVTEALVAAGVAPSRLILVEFDPTFCRILRSRYPDATLVQGDAYSLRRLLETLLSRPAAAVVSGLPLITKPLRMRLRLLRDAFDLMLPGAPFVQFTYSVASPLPKRLGGYTAEASERIWLNIPPARVWVYRKT